MKTYIRAFHPNAACCSGLFLKSNTQLKQHIDDLCITNVDKRNNPDMRKAIWGACGDALERSLIDIDIGVSESGDIWSKITPIMPSFALFQADRKNSDKDSEVQDPFIYAIREIMKKPSIQESLSTVADEVRGALSVVTDATAKKLEDLNPDLVEALDACIPENSLLKWSDVFKAVSIESDTAIPLNKRGSGIRRLILLSFFQAEAERRRAAVAIPSIVYAIEEPEISQHPDHQRALVESLIALSLTSNTQILLTTHSPEIVKKLEFKNIRLISKELPIIRGVKSKELPYPSLNEVNYLAFDEVTLDYHNELYSFIEYHNLLSEFIVEKPTRNYIKKTREREVVTAINLSQYIRHQIHHPENDFNKRFSIDELQTSVGEMRAFIIAQREGRARET